MNNLPPEINRVNNNLFGGTKPAVTAAVCLLTCLLLPAPLSGLLDGVYLFLPVGLAGGAAAYALFYAVKGLGIGKFKAAALLLVCAGASAVFCRLFTSDIQKTVLSAGYIFPGAVLSAKLSAKPPAPKEIKPDLFERALQRLKQALKPFKPDDGEKPEKAAETAPVPSYPSRVSCITAMSAVLGAAFAVFMVALLIAERGGFNPSIFSDWLAEQTERIQTIISSFTMENGGETRPLYTGENLTFMVNYILLVLPAVIIVFCLISSWLSTLVFAICSLAAGFYRRFFEYGWPVKISRSSAVVFIAVYLGAMFFGRNPAVYILFANFVLILTPGFVLIGVRDTILKLADDYRRPSGILLIAASVILAFVNFMAVFVLMSFAGVVYTLFERRRNRNDRRDGDDNSVS
ncbi:MAG: hypothetical protein GX897_01185 [Clostridiales bacterium]|nr:hypothetical protein [Clostridiales bacterium]